MQEENKLEDKLSSRLLRLIKENGVKQKDLAQAINVSHITISRYINEGREPGLQELYRLANFFNVSMEFLLKGEGACDGAPEFNIENEINSDDREQTKNTTNSLFISRLKEETNRKLLTQNQLGALTEISQSTISSYMLGRTAPKSDELLKLATFFDVTMDYLWGASNEKSISDTDPSIPDSEWKKRAIEAEKKLKALKNSISHLCRDVQSLSQNISNLSTSLIDE